MKEKKLKPISPGVAFGSNVECPKCGGSDLKRMWRMGFENFHSETLTKEYMLVICQSCHYEIGKENTKDAV